MAQGDVIINIKTVASGLSAIDQTKAKLAQLDAEARKGGVSVFALKEKLLSLKEAQFTERDVSKIRLYNAEIKATTTEIKALEAAGTQGFGGVGKAANSAFSSLRKIAYVLPGIGIAGLLAFAVEPIVGFIGKLTEATEAEKRLAAQAKLVADLNEDTADIFGKDESALLSLRAAIEGTNVPMKTRIDAIKELKKEFPEYFSQLSNEQLLTGQVAGAYDLATQAILRRARATAAQSQLDKIQSDKLKILLNDQIDAEKTLAQLNKIKKPKVISNAAIGPIGTEGKSVTDLKNEVVELRNIRVAAAQQQIDDLNKQQAFLTNIIQQGADGIVKVEKDKKERIKKTVTDVLSELQRELQGFDAIGAALGIDKTKEKISAITSAVEELVKRFKVAPGDTIIQKLLGSANVSGLLDKAKADLLGGAVDLQLRITPRIVLKSGIDKDAIEKQISEQGITIPIIPKIELPPVDSPTDQFFLKGQELADKLNEGLQASLESGVENIAISFGDTLGKALIGKANFGDFFTGIFKQVGAGLKQLGEFFIKTAIEIKIFKDFATKNPVLAIAAGIGLIAIGSLIEAATSKQKAFATGGLVPGVGNRDSVSAILTPGEFVLNKSAVRNIGVGNVAALNRGSSPTSTAAATAGSQDFNLNGQLVARGTDLVLVLNRANQKLARVG